VTGIDAATGGASWGLSQATNTNPKPAMNITRDKRFDTLNMVTDDHVLIRLLKG
jgi:hypothetical protein